MSMSLVCENSLMQLDCEQKNGIIRINRANYGRFSLKSCNNQGVTDKWNVSCILTNSTTTVAERLVLLEPCLKLYIVLKKSLDGHLYIIREFTRNFEKPNNDLPVCLLFYSEFSCEFIRN